MIDVKYTKKEVEYVKTIREGLPDEEKERFLREGGWETWYSPGYWIHSKVVSDPEIQDKTDYGIGMDEAFIYEVLNAPPIPSKWGIPGINKLVYDITESD